MIREQIVNGVSNGEEKTHLLREADRNKLDLDKTIQLRKATKFSQMQIKETIGATWSTKEVFMVR